MFGKNRKKEEVENCGDAAYTMKENYNPSLLVVANLERVSSEFTNFGPMVETTEQKYIFEIIEGEKIQYREVFTGFIADDDVEYFDLPYVVNPKPFTDYFPKITITGIPKLSLIWALNDINHSDKEKDNEPENGDKVHSISM